MANRNGIVGLLIGALAAGCGGGGLPKRPDASSDAPSDASSDASSDSFSTDAPVEASRLDASLDGAFTDATVDAKSLDATTPFDGGPGRLQLAVKGDIQLVGNGADTCTNQLPAAGDRWCAFARSSTTPDTFELWVLDVSKIASNQTVTCDGTDGSCLRLSTSLYVDPTNGLRIDGFDGDTLVYSEMSAASASGFAGVVSAWRPGWAGGRALTSHPGGVCNGHPTTRAAACFENIALDAAGNETAELHAGTLDAAPGGSLPFVDTILVQGKNDAAGIKKWAAKLSPDGMSIAWSTRATASGTEDLRIQIIGDDTSRILVASDVSQWVATRGSDAWLWLSAYNYDQSGFPSGTLQSAAYPAGARVQTLATSVADFQEAGALGVVYRTKVVANTGTLVVTPDRRVPATVRTLDQGVTFVFEVSKDGGRVSYTKNIQTLATNVFVFDLWLSDTQGAPPCALSATATGFLPPQFLSDGSLAAWGRFNTLTGAVDGLYTTTSDCQTRGFAHDLFSFTPIADKGFIFLDTLSPDPNVNQATLRYAQVAGTALPATGTVIQAQASLSFATLAPALPVVVYTVNAGTAADGLYVDAALPFTP